MTSEKETHDQIDHQIKDAVESTAEEKTKPKEKRFSRKKQTPSEAHIQKLEENIAALEGEITILIQAKLMAEDKMKRVAADFDNMTKRKEREFNRTLSFARENLVRDLLPLLDDLERSAQFDESSNNSEKNTDPEVKNTQQTGIRMIYERFLKYLQETGVERFDPTGEAFNPDIHDAMLTRAVENTKPGIVLECFQPGYKLGDRILRHAKVIVSE
ncbi:MAG: nucleotide exchange factor GrpE [Candidatus Marinimicrobia bacterium CG1_02_48_14]|nr:MAG: nucleotide exchange factor GrpE [Candidatus Marinimicrobia bacterium CG1_02_48_14]